MFTEPRIVLEEALAGIRGPDQQRIATVGVDWIGLLLAKNSDYGSSAWKEPFLAPGLPVSSAILVRMSDKVERIRSLIAKARGNHDAEPEVEAESLRDTIADLGAYCLLYLAAPEHDQSPSPIRRYEATR